MRETRMASATWRRTGLPSSGSVSLFSPMRLDCPAASTTAAMRAGAARPRAGRSSSAREAGAPGGVFQQAADAHRPDVRRADGLPRHHKAQDMVEAIELGRAGAAGHSDDRNRADRAQSQQIAGIDRHPEMLDPSAGLDDCGGDHILAVGGRSRPRKSAPDRRPAAVRRRMSRASPPARAPSECRRRARRQAPPAGAGWLAPSFPERSA